MSPENRRKNVEVVGKSFFFFFLHTKRVIDARLYGFTANPGERISYHTPSRFAGLVSEPLRRETRATGSPSVRVLLSESDAIDEFVSRTKRSEMSVNAIRKNTKIRSFLNKMFFFSIFLVKFYSSSSLLALTKNVNFRRVLLFESCAITGERVA